MIDDKTYNKGCFMILWTAAIGAILITLLIIFT